MILDVVTRENESVSLHGVIAIFDLKGVTLGHALQLPPKVIKRMVHSWQSCYPLRIQSLNFVNAPAYVNVVLNIFRRFMNQKLKNRIHVHNQGVGALHKNVPPNMLPLEYGGTDGTLQDLKDYWKSMAEENRQWFFDDEKYKIIL